MKVLHVVHYPDFSGPHNQALRLAGPLHNRGWDTVILLPQESGNAGDRFASTPNVEVLKLPLHRIRARINPWAHIQFAASFFPEILAIRASMRRLRIDVVIVTGVANPHAAIAGSIANVAVVWQLLDSFGPTALRRLMMPLVRRLAKSVMFTGSSLEELYADGKPMKVPSSVYFPPVDTRAFIPSDARRSKTRHLLGIPEGAEVIGIVANLSPMKGIEYFVRAAAHIHARRPGTWFVLVGAPLPTHHDYASSVTREASTSGIPKERIIFTGLRVDVENYYPAMDIKLITSLPRSEGIPTTAIEAMACGVPVVAANVGAVRDVVQDGVTGLLVPAVNARALAEATIWLLSNVAIRAQMGQAARRAAIEKYDVEICADVHVKAFEMALAQRRDLVRS